MIDDLLIVREFGYIERERIAFFPNIDYLRIDKRPKGCFFQKGSKRTQVLYDFSLFEVDQKFAFLYDFSHLVVIFWFMFT